MTPDAAIPDLPGAILGGATSSMEMAYGLVAWIQLLLLLVVAQLLFTFLLNTGAANLFFWNWLIPFALAFLSFAVVCNIVLTCFCFFEYASF